MNTVKGALRQIALMSLAWVTIYSNTEAAPSQAIMNAAEVIEQLNLGQQSILVKKGLLVRYSAANNGTLWEDVNGDGTPDIRISGIILTVNSLPDGSQSIDYSVPPQSYLPLPTPVRRNDILTSAHGTVVLIDANGDGIGDYLAIMLPGDPNYYYLDQSLVGDPRVAQLLQSLGIVFNNGQFMGANGNILGGLYMGSIPMGASMGSLPFGGATLPTVNQDIMWSGQFLAGHALGGYVLGPDGRWHFQGEGQSAQFPNGMMPLANLQSFQGAFINPYGMVEFQSGFAFLQEPTGALGTYGFRLLNKVTGDWIIVMDSMANLIDERTMTYKNQPEATYPLDGAEYQLIKLQVRGLDGQPKKNWFDDGGEYVVIRKIPTGYYIVEKEEFEWLKGQIEKDGSSQAKKFQDRFKSKLGWFSKFEWNDKYAKRVQLVKEHATKKLPAGMTAPGTFLFGGQNGMTLSEAQLKLLSKQLEAYQIPLSVLFNSAMNSPVGLPKMPPMSANIVSGEFKVGADGSLTTVNDSKKEDSKNKNTTYKVKILNYSSADYPVYKLKIPVAVGGGAHQFKIASLENGTHYVVGIDGKVIFNETALRELVDTISQGTEIDYGSEARSADAKAAAAPASSGSQSASHSSSNAQEIFMSAAEFQKILDGSGNAYWIGLTGIGPDGSQVTVPFTNKVKVDDVDGQVKSAYEVLERSGSK